VKLLNKGKKINGRGSREFQMTENESLNIEFKLPDSVDDSSPTEFRYLFTAIDEMTRSLVISQVNAFIDWIDLGSRARDEVYVSIFRSQQSIAVPVDVVSIRHESPWAIEVSLRAAGVLWILHKLVGPTIVQAWGESKLRESFLKFLRDGIFRGAKQQLESSAAAKPQYGNLRVDDISEGSRRRDSAAVTVTLRRTEVLQVESSDRELMNEFLAKLRIKT
jgi:hypothetical protein